MTGPRSAPNPEELHQHAQLPHRSDAAALPHPRLALTGEDSPEGAPVNDVHTPAPAHTDANQNWRETQLRKLAPEMLTGEIDPETFAHGPTSSLEEPAKKAGEMRNVRLSQQSGLRYWKHFFSGLTDWSQYPVRQAGQCGKSTPRSARPIPAWPTLYKKAACETRLDRLRDANRLLNIGVLGCEFLSFEQLGKAVFHISGMAINQAEIFV